MLFTIPESRRAAPPHRAASPTAAGVVRKFVSRAVLRQYHLELTRLYWLDRSTSGRLGRTIEFRLPAILLGRTHISAFNPFNGCGAATVSPSGCGAGVWPGAGGGTVRPCTQGPQRAELWRAGERKRARGAAVRVARRIPTTGSLLAVDGIAANFFGSEP
jgi:hypothetical protein